MSEQREYEDGAFYWVRLARDGWSIGEYEYELGAFRLPGRENAYWPSDFDEIGPRLGKEPPKRRRPRVKSQATSPELDKALRILLTRQAACHGD